jgi:uncharacterized membrane protein HdeD (DUF308 family)
MAESNVLERDINSVALRGVVVLLFGLAAVFWPALTTLTFVYIFSAFILVTGIISMVTSITDMGKDQYWFINLMIGLLELGIGVYLVRHPGITLASFILLIGIVLVVRGVLEIIRALFGKDTGDSRTLMAIVGLISAVAGLVILREPVSGGVAFVWVLGVYAIFSGSILLAIASSAREAVIKPTRR